MKATVIGLGYVGLTTSLCLADRGTDVFGCEIEESMARAIKSDSISFYEPGISELLNRYLGNSLKLLTA